MTDNPPASPTPPTPAVAANGTLPGSAGSEPHLVRRRGVSWQDRELWAQGGLLALGFMAFFHHWLYTQHRHSSGAIEDWGHAYIVPLISGYLIWLRREAIARVQPRTYWLGLVPMLAGIAIYVLFVATPLPGGHMVQGWAAILTIFGMALLLLGPKVMKHLFLPIAYLVFAVTISERVMIQLTFKLQLIASQGAYVVLSVLGAITGFTADVGGNTITLYKPSGASVPLNVAEACSGMRMVVAFFALAGATALISCRFFWQRALLMLLAAPVAILLNIGRVTTLGLLSLANPEFSKGEAHTFIGTILLIPGLLMFMGIVWALNKAVPPEPKVAKPAAKPAVRVRQPLRWAKVASLPVVVSIAILAASTVSMQAAIAHFKIYLLKKPIYPEPVNGGIRVLRALPTETANWTRMGEDHIEAAETAEVLGTDNYLTRIYVEKNPAPGQKPRYLQLHVAYYTGMIDTVPHVPERCFTGGGMSLTGGPWTVPVPVKSDDWVLMDERDNPGGGKVYTTRLSNEWSTAGGGRRVPLPRNVTPDNPLTLRVTEYTEGSGRFFAGYFFVANGGVASSAEEVRLLAFDLKTDYAYYLKVQFGSSDVGSPEELAALSGELLRDLLGEVMTCVPDWTKVERGLWPPDNGKGQTPKAPTP